MSDNNSIRIAITNDFYPKPDAFFMTFTVIQTVYGGETLLLMLILIVHLRSYKNSFYRLVQIDLVTNCLLYVNSFTTTRFSHYQFGLEFAKKLEFYIPGSLTLSNIGIPFFFSLQFCTALSLNIHRMTSVLFPIKYDKMWSRYYLIYYIFFIILSALPRVVLPGKLSTFSVENDTIIYTSYLEHQTFSSYLYAISVFFFFLSIAIISFSTAILVKKKATEYRFSSVGIHVARKLTKIALTYSILYTGSMCWSMLQAVNAAFGVFKDVTLVHSFTLLQMTNDLMTFSLPYILMIFDTNVQRKFLRIGARNGAQSPVFVSNST